MRHTSFLSAVSLLAAVSSAWPWPQGSSPLEVAKRELYPLVAERAATSSFDLSLSLTQGNTATTKARTTQKGQETSSTKSDGKNSASSSSATGTGKDAKTTNGGKTTTGKETGKTTEKSTYETTKTFDARLPAGGVSMVTPNIMSGAQYYKIADYVTFAWNYTSLSIYPTAVDIFASCTTNSATYTIAMNQSVPTEKGAQQAVTWDTGKYQASATVPLLVATYTLYIYDADSGVTDMPRAGYLGVYDQLTFGMYTPQPYTPIADYVCATCNSAMSSMTRHTLGFMFGMVAVTVLSFGWFAGVAGLW